MSETPELRLEGRKDEQQLLLQPDKYTKTIDLMDGVTGEVIYEFTTKQEVTKFLKDLELFFKTNISILAK